MCIFLLNGWEYRDNLKCMLNIRFLLFRWNKKIFTPTNHIATMFLTVFSVQYLSILAFPFEKTSTQTLIDQIHQCKGIFLSQYICCHFLWAYPIFTPVPMQMSVDLIPPVHMPTHMPIIMYKHTRK